MVAVAEQIITVEQRLYPQQFAFLHDHRRYPAFIGGRNCVAAETVVSGVPIAERLESFAAETMFGYRASTPSFLKGRANLYRVRTKSGRVVTVAEGHRFLTPIGWHQLQDLRVGVLIAASESENVLTAFERVRGSADRYSPGSHQRDGLSSPWELVAQDRLRRLHTIDDDTTPRLTFRLSSLDASHHLRQPVGDVRRNGQGDDEQPRHQSQNHPQSASTFLPQDIAGQPHPLEAGEREVSLCRRECLVLSESSIHLTDTSQGFEQLHADCQSAATVEVPPQGQTSALNTCRCEYPADARIPTPGSGECRDAEQQLTVCQVPDRAEGFLRDHISLPCVNYTTFWDEIDDISFVRFGDYYDITVPSTGHYAAHGLWHHNSGKTFTGAYKAFERMSRGGLGIVAGPSFPQMKLGPKPRLLKVLDDAGIVYRENKNENTLYAYGLNAEVQFAGLENDTYTRGPNYGWGWIDELDFVANPEMYKTAKASVRDGDSYQLFSTSTPKGQYIIWREWVLNADDFHKLYKASTYDNFFVDADSFVAGLGYVGSFYEQEINADFVKLEGLVYPGFDRMTQVRVVDCADWPCALGLDSGLHTTALMTMRYSGDRFHIERELYRGNMSNGDIVDAVCEEYARTGALFVVFDPAAGNLGVDLQRQDLHVRKAQKFPGSVEDGIRRVNGILPGLTVDPSCRNFIAEIEAYQYPPKHPEKDQPIKANDHLMDDLRYLAMELSASEVEVDFF